MSDPTKVSRRLVAVFAADVEGYSRLMGADEVGTLKRLTERRASPVTTVKLLCNRGGRLGATRRVRTATFVTVLAITTPCSSLQGAIIVSIQSPVGEPRMKRQLDSDQKASEGPS